MRSLSKFAETAVSVDPRRAVRLFLAQSAGICCSSKLQFEETGRNLLLRSATRRLNFLEHPERNGLQHFRIHVLHSHDDSSRFHGAVLFENKAFSLLYMANTYGRGNNYTNESSFTEIAWQGFAEKNKTNHLNIRCRVRNSETQL